MSLGAVTGNRAESRYGTTSRTMPLSALVEEAIRALEQRPFGERIEQVPRKHKKAKRVA